MSRTPESLPLVRPLPADFSLQRAFALLSRKPGCLLLDSASHLPEPQGRYSFLTADPVRWLIASPEDPDPWPVLRRWALALPAESDSELPPFQGGIAGLIGYEAGAWLEPVGLARENDLPTAAIAVGLYDWTIAVDHRSGSAWLVSQGLGAARPSARYAEASRRADQVQRWLGETLPETVEVAGVAPLRLTAQPTAQYPTAHARVTSNFTSSGYRAQVAEIVRRIRSGDSFQVNLAQRLLRPADCASPELYRRLRRSNPAPFCGYFDAGEFQVLSSSPEGFLKVTGRDVETRPIKGTVSKTGDTETDHRLAEQLIASEKDRAENVMIVDLMRNDLSRVCDDDSVEVAQLCGLERYQYVQHLVSAVRGRLRGGADVVDLLKACFPGGSITGAPKVEAMRTIAQLEPHRRGPYCGSLGYISCGGAADFNILIRTITAAGGYWQIPVGGGITARSEPEAEEAETWAKAEGMLRAVEQA